jgi:hypothetical protein
LHLGGDVDTLWGMRSVEIRPRAERFDLRVPARVRPCGHATWRDADIVNVSRTGILLALASPLPPADTIDVEFTLTPAIELADVRCVGHIVRETVQPGGRMMVAASFAEPL